MISEKNFFTDFLLQLPENGQAIDNEALADMVISIGKMNPSLFSSIIYSMANYDKEIERIKKYHQLSHYEYQFKNRTINKLDLFRPYAFSNQFSKIFDSLFEHYCESLPDKLANLLIDFETSYFITLNFTKEFKAKLIKSSLKPQTILYTQAIEHHVDKFTHSLSSKDIMNALKYEFKKNYSFNTLYHLDKDYSIEQTSFISSSQLKASWQELNVSQKSEAFCEHIDTLFQPVLYSTYSTLYLTESEEKQKYAPLSFTNKVALDTHIFLKSISENYELKKHGLSLGDKKIKKFSSELFDLVLNFYMNAQGIPFNFFEFSEKLKIHVGHSLYHLPKTMNTVHFIHQELANENTPLFKSIEEFTEKNPTKKESILEYLFDTHFEEHKDMLELNGKLFSKIQSNLYYPYHIRLPYVNNVVSFLKLLAIHEKKEQTVFVPQLLQNFLDKLNQANKKDILFLLPINFNISNREAVTLFEKGLNAEEHLKSKYFQSLDLYKIEIEKALISYQLQDNVGFKTKNKVKL